MKKTSADELWIAYRQDRSIENRNLLAEFYQPLVEKLSNKYHVTLPYSVELDDVKTSANFGLLDAIEKFAPERGVKFHSYAGRRIYGAMVDELREMDWVPRLTRRRHVEVVGVQSLYTPIPGDAKSDIPREVEDVVMDDKAVEDVDECDRRDWFKWVCRGLPADERMIVQLYYLDQVTMKEVGQAIGLSESRVSQMHTNLLERLRAKMSRAGREC